MTSFVATPPPSPPPSTAAPSREAGARRLDSLDLLRGVAILGIFLMNTQSMAYPQWTYTNPTFYSPLNDDFYFQGRDYWTWVIVHLVADLKFITIFSFLFGAGILLQGESAARKGLRPARVHYARMGILLLFGLLHAFLFWIGDILTTYALCGILLFPLRRLPAWSLALLGFAMICVLPALQILRYSNVVVPGVDWAYRWENFFTHGINTVEFQLDAYRGPWLHQMRHRLWSSLDGQVVGFLTWTFWRCGGAILLGMALHKARFFSGNWRVPVYALLASVLVPTGWLISYAGVFYNDHKGWDDYVLLKAGFLFNYVGSLAVAMGYMCVGVLVAFAASSRVNLHKILEPIRAVGRMALTNYLAQTLVGTTLFYGHGLGWYGSVERFGLLGIVGITWVVQMAGSWLWIKKIGQGPIETLWHRLVYGKKPVASE